MAEIWNHFQKLSNETAQCKTCPKIIQIKGGSTSGMTRHLEHKHKKKEADQESGTGGKPNKIRKLDTPPTPGLQQKTMLAFVKRQTLPEIVARLAAKDGLSIHVITKSEFIRQSIVERGFKLPTSKTSVMKLVRSFYVEAKKTTVAKIQARFSEGEFVSLTTDEWTSGANKRYLNINVHFSDSKFVNLGLTRIRGSCPAEKLAQTIEHAIGRFDINSTNVSAVTTDGPKVMVKLGTILPFIHQTCYNHALHLAVCDVLYRSSAPDSDSADLSDHSETESESDSDNEFESDLESEHDQDESESGK